MAGVVVYGILGERAEEKLKSSHARAELSGVGTLWLLSIVKLTNRS